MNKKRNAIMIADTRPALVGNILLQLQETNKSVFDEAVIYYTEITQEDMDLMQSIMPCRFIKYDLKLTDDILKLDRFRRFSILMFARCEMFKLIDNYNSIVWTDTDVVIQGSLKELIEETRNHSGLAMLCEDNDNKTSKTQDTVRSSVNKNIQGYNMDGILYTTGLIVITDNIKIKADYTQWCYDKILEYADNFNLPDVAIYNLLIQEYEIKPLRINGNKYCRYPYIGRNLSDAIVIHSWGANKFWNDWLLLLKVPKWKEEYEKWVSMGGSRLNCMFLPEISVVIPVYKPNLEYFKQCLDSLLIEQKINPWEHYSNFEVIIVAEPSNQKEIADFVGKYNDPRVNLIFNEERLGIAGSINKGVRLAKGRYIARMDDDDLAASYRLFKQVEYLNKNPQITLCTSDFEYFGDMNERRISFEGEMSRAWSIFTCPFDHPTIMFRKEFFVENSLFYDEERGFVEDWELWGRAFSAGMTVGCIHEVLLYHRWLNTGSAGQTDKTVNMMRELIQKNFKKLNVSIMTDDLYLIGPWNGQIIDEKKIEKVERYFKSALDNNEKLKCYDQISLRKAFELRLIEVRSGILPGLVEKIEPEKAEWESHKVLPRSYTQSTPKKTGVIKTFFRNLLKPLYRPFRHRYEDRIVNIQENTWQNGGHLLNCIDKLDSQRELMQMIEQRMAMSEQTINLVTSCIEKVDSQMELMRMLEQTVNRVESETLNITLPNIIENESEKTRSSLLDKIRMQGEETHTDIYVKSYEAIKKVNKASDETHRHVDFIYRDLMIAINRIGHFLPESKIRLMTENPIAYESLDHLYPHGTIRDNTRYPRFVEKCEELLDKHEDVSFLDLGCSGGGMVLEAALRGHISIGLEGSDSSLKEQRAEWRLLGDRLQTCDITKPFRLVGQDNLYHRFDIITAWEVMEHIAEIDLPQLFHNIKDHLSEKGYFICSIANWADIDPETGVNWHVTTKPYEWWKVQFENAGFELCSELLDSADLARGGYNPPHCYEAPYLEIDTEKTFHVVSRLLKKTSQ